MRDKIDRYIKKDKRYIYIIIAALAIIAFGTVPFYIDVDTSFFPYYLFLCFCYIVLSQGWNLLAGYTGQISLGTHAFFALGAYTTAIIWINDVTKTWYYFDPLVMVLSGIVPTIFAIIIGLPLLSRLRGDYFSFGTLAAAEVLRILILRGGDFTRGSNGLRLPADGFESMEPYYWTGLLLAIAATAGVYWIAKSRIGLALRALSEDETSAASHGIHILKYKLFAFAVSSFLMGICGSLYAYYLFIVNPGGVMNLNWMFIPILICILGGNGTILGPIIGAFVVGALFSYADVYVGQTHPMVSGVLIVLVMKFMPTGIMGLKEKISPHR
jgi:branched-chain amino acid transport system permease protein